MVVEGFLRELQTLFQYEFIKVGKGRRVEPDGIFNKQNDLYTGRLGIGRCIHFIFQQFDDGKQQLGIA